MTEHDYFEAWWKKQELGDKTNYESNRAWRMVAWNGWLARSALCVPPEALCTTVPEGFQLLRDSTHEQRSWPEDASHENGNYYCLCCVCGRQFTGHKRRVLCKVCDAETVNPACIPSPLVDKSGG